MIKSICTVTVVLVCCLSCKQDGSKDTSGVFNPNGDSELALLMRDMFKDGMQVKQQLLDGKAPVVACDFQKIYTAEATQPEKVASPQFAVMASSYERTVKTLQAAQPENRVTAYNYMVDACMQCHQTMCPGPMVKIRKMYLTEAEVNVN